MRIRLAITIVCTVMCCLVAKAGDKFTLVVDAGHGGKDVGAQGTYSKEKDINLSVALAFGRLVEQNCGDVKVVYTRKTDKFVELHERANIANRCKADLFVSIHTNALPKGKQAVGMETYTLGMHRAGDNFDVAKRENSVILYESDYQQRYEGFDPNSSESYIIFEFLQDKNMAKSVEMAKFVQRRACAAANRSNKGVKQAGFLVLRETSMPSCLIELGFITTPSEEAFLNSESGKSSLVNGIFNAFLDYKQKYYGGINVPYKPEVSMKEIERQREAAADTLAAATPDTIAKPAVAGDIPMFKVQILASNRSLKAGDKQLKGETAVGVYEENGMFKYTVGESPDYNEIYRLRKSLLEKFPEAFIIAFKNGEKMNVVEAIKEFKRNRNNAKTPKTSE